MSEFMSKDQSEQRISEDQLQRIHEAIDDNVLTSQSAPSMIRHSLFQLAREVKTIVGFDRKVDPGYKTIVRNWHKKSLRYLLHDSFDVSWAQFIKSWDAAKYSTDRALFWSLVTKAYNLPYPPICKNYDDVAKDLIRFCAVLDSYWSPEPFYLSCRTATLEFGHSHSTMADLLRMLVMEGVLKEESKGTPRGKASRYRFLAEKGKIDLSSIETNGESNKEVL